MGFARLNASAMWVLPVNLVYRDMSGGTVTHGRRFTMVLPCIHVRIFRYNAYVLRHECRESVG